MTPGKEEDDAPPWDELKDLLERLHHERAEVGGLREQIHELKTFVWRVAETNTAPNVLERGFCELAAQLAPLRELAPHQRQPMEDDEVVRLCMLRNAMAAPKWTGGGSLPIPEHGVPFIGELAPRDARECDKFRSEKETSA